MLELRLLFKGGFGNVFQVVKLAALIRRWSCGLAWREGAELLGRRQKLGCGVELALSRGCGTESTDPMAFTRFHAAVGVLAVADSPACAHERLSQFSFAKMCLSFRHAIAAVCFLRVYVVWGGNVILCYATISPHITPRILRIFLATRLLRIRFSMNDTLNAWTLILVM